MHSEESTMTAGRITVYGSCVARDVAGEMERRGWSVERYIARQSLISAGRPADVGDLDLSLLRSSFARRSFLSDMVGNLEAQLTAVASYTDLLLWDLTDERLGVQDAGDEIAGDDSAPDAPEVGFRTDSYCYEHGLRDYVAFLNKSKKAELIHPEIIDFEAEQSLGENHSISLEIAMQWTSAYSESVHTYANTINTTEGGTHEEGFRTALTTLVNKYARDKGLLKERDDNLTGDDIREGLTAVISVKLSEPQFEGQTKTKLGNTEARTFVQQTVYAQLGDWLDSHPGDARAIITKASQAAARASWSRPPCPASCATAPRRTPRTPRSSSSRETPPVAPPSAAATPSTRRSCRSAARSSTWRRRAWTGPCPPTRSAASSPPSAPESARTSTSPSCATARS